MKPVSVIIPLAPGEDAWRNLLPALNLPNGSEIILAAGPQTFEIDESDKPYQIHVVTEGQGRASQMNAGAQVAQHEWLWFLHADTRLEQSAIPALNSCIAGNAKALFFFDLKFADDGPAAMNWNAWAVQWRAGRLKLPFGDQAFLLRKDLFKALGAYREDLKYGEDHVLVWKAHQMGVPVLSMGVSVYTSARRYQDNGWFNTTSRFVFLTLKQAFPQWLLLQKYRFIRLFR